MQETAIVSAVSSHQPSCSGASHGELDHHLLSVEPQKEKLASEQLLLYYPTVSIFFPVDLVTRRVRHVRRIRQVEVPRFPGYLFVCFVHGLPRNVRDLSFCRGFVKFGQELAVVKGKEVEKMKMGEVISEGLRPGGKAYVSQGPFSNKMVQVLKMLNHAAIVQPDGMNATVKIPIDHLVPL